MDGQLLRERDKVSQKVAEYNVDRVNKHSFDVHQSV